MLACLKNPLPAGDSGSYGFHRSHSSRDFHSSCSSLWNSRELRQLQLRTGNPRLSMTVCTFVPIAGDRPFGRLAELRKQCDALLAEVADRLAEHTADYAGGHFFRPKVGRADACKQSPSALLSVGTPKLPAFPVTRKEYANIARKSQACTKKVKWLQTAGKSRNVPSATPPNSRTRKIHRSKVSRLQWPR